MLDTTLWVAQGFLGLFFLAAGLPKVIGRGIERWVGFDRLARPLVITIGISEVAAACALVVPMLIDVFEWTTPLAAIGLAVVSLMASGFHLRASETLPAVETALWPPLLVPSRSAGGPRCRPAPPCRPISSRPPSPYSFPRRSPTWCFSPGARSRHAPNAPARGGVR